MMPEPLHPAIIHFPIVLALMLPFAVAAAVIWIRRGAHQRQAWSVIVAMAAILFGASFASVKTGEAQEERVEDVIVSERPLHDHEEAAERFLVLAGIVLALSPIGLLKGRAGVAGRSALAVGSIALALAIWPVGRSGGDLVYRHGAAQASVGQQAGDGQDVAARRSGRTESDGGH